MCRWAQISSVTFGPFVHLKRPVRADVHVRADFSVTLGPYFIWKVAVATSGVFINLFLFIRYFRSPIFFFLFSLSRFPSVGLHIDLALLHSCTFVSLVTELSCALDHSSNAFALAQGASQNRVPFDTFSFSLFSLSLSLCPRVFFLLFPSRLRVSCVVSVSHPSTRWLRTSPLNQLLVRGTLPAIWET